MAEIEMTAAWMVVQTKPWKELLVERALRDLGVPSFLPRIHATVRAGKHSQHRIQPMFPTYVFARLEATSPVLAIRYLPGVRDFLRSGELPQTVAPEIVALLRERIGPTGIFEPPAIRFRAGDRVRIEEGPLRGLEAIFERELSGPKRVAVLLSSIALPARVILGTSALAAA